MNSTKTDTIEIHAESVDQAIQEGLQQLGVTRDQVQIEVVEEGRRGFLGIGNREAIVRLTPSAPAPAAPAYDPFDDEFENLPDPELLEEQETAQACLELLLDKMGLDVTLNSYLTEPDDLGKQVVQVDIDGEDAKELVGRRGETLTSLQFLARLMVSQQLKRRVDFVVDIASFRRQREEGLRKLADRMAQKVIKQNRPITLEPMSPYERRLVHMALRDHSKVFTKSIGSGDDRRVKIWPKR